MMFALCAITSRVHVFNTRRLTVGYLCIYLFLRVMSDRVQKSSLRERKEDVDENVQRKQAISVRRSWVLIALSFRLQSGS